MNETTATLERLKYIIYQRLSQELIDELANMPDVEFSQYVDFMISNPIAMRIKGEILGREIKQIESVYPADWWQAFKERWFPQWLKERHPVIYKRERLIAQELYPTMPIPGYEPTILLKKKEWKDERNDGDT